MPKKKQPELSSSRIVILDDESGVVYIKYVPLSMIELDGTEILEELGFNENHCTYMIVGDDDIVIETEGKDNA